MNWHFDHAPGFPPVTFAPEIFSRLITYKQEIGINSEQLDKFITMKRDYHLRYHEICNKIDAVVEEIDKFIHKEEININDVFSLIDEHTKLINELERTFFQVTIAGSKLLSKEQTAELRRLYHRDKDKVPKLYR